MGVSGNLTRVDRQFHCNRSHGAPREPDPNKEQRILLEKQNKLARILGRRVSSFTLFVKVILKKKNKNKNPTLHSPASKR